MKNMNIEILLAVDVTFEEPKTYTDKAKVL